MQRSYERLQGDRLIWWITILLSVISIPVIYSATGGLAESFKGGKTAYFAIKHGVILLISLVLMYYIHLANHRFLSKLSVLLIIIAVPLLLFTMVSGMSANSATRWIRIPIINLSFQTSDFAKLALTIYLARVLSKKQDILEDFKQVFVHIFGPVLMVCALTVKEDFSTTALIFGTSLIIMFFGNVKLQHMGAVLGGILLLFLLVYLINPDLFPRMETWISRLSSWSSASEDVEGNFQSNLAKASVIDGGFFGAFFNGGAKYPAPPQASSDFVFATLVKSIGFTGGLVVILLYLLLLFRSIKVAVKAEKMFSMLLVIGLSLGITFQALSNIAVAVGVFPVTGQPLPMMSMGGTSIWFSAISLGIILSVSRENKMNKSANKNS